MGRRNAAWVGSGWAMMGGVLLGASCLGQGVVAGGAVAGGNRKPEFSVKAGVREGFDSNVFLQSETDRADRASWVSTLMGELSGAWSTEAWKARVGYQPEASFYHSESSEDFVAHRMQGEVHYQEAKTLVDLGVSVTVIDGDSEGPTWTGPGGAPAAGGPAVRDRRDAAVYRGNVRLTQEWGRWFLRPVVTGYDHDFQTVQRATPGYQNYVDRSEVTAGLDGGRSVAPGLRAGLGYRYGVQDESHLLGYPEEYDNQFHRFLAVLEGPVAKWVRASISAGPELRRYGADVPQSFRERDVVNFYVDASVTLVPGKSDSVVVSAKQFEQPGFSGRSAYEDLTLDVAWRHCLSPRWTVGAGGRAYNTDFLEPVVRHDWVLSVNSFVHYDFTKKCGAEASYAYEDGETQDPGASGREYERHWVAVGVRMAFQ